MKINKKLILIFLSSIISIIFYINNNIKNTILVETGIKTRIIETKKIYNGSPHGENYHFNYYFLTKNGSKIQITYYLNRKQLTTGIAKYRNKFIFYSKEDPNDFVVESEVSNKNLIFYLVFINALFYVIIKFLYSIILKKIRY